MQRELANLRGGESGAPNSERGLGFSAGSTSLSSSQSIWRCIDSGSLCFDDNQFCLAYASSYSYSNAVGSAAYAFELLSVYAECEAASLAVGQSYAIIGGSTNVNLKTKTSGPYCTDLDVNMSLKTATLSITIAASQATAAASATDFAFAYTDAAAACQNPAIHNTIFCNADATAVQAGSASAGSYSGGLTGSVAGSSTATTIDVDASGTGVSQVAACLASFAESFAFSASETTAMAEAYVSVINSNFAEACANAYQKHCGPAGDQPPFCTSPSAQACSQAAAYGNAGACAGALASALAESVAKVKLGVVLQATARPNGLVTLASGACGEAIVQTYCAI